VADTSFDFVFVLLDLSIDFADRSCVQIFRSVTRQTQVFYFTACERFNIDLLPVKPRFIWSFVGKANVKSLLILRKKITILITYIVFQMEKPLKSPTVPCDIGIEKLDKNKTTTFSNSLYKFVLFTYGSRYVF
jgi:hypothetical protein